MSLHHFVSHISEIESYRGEGSYTARRLVHFGGGGAKGTAGICGYAHAAELYLPPGIKLLSHWHSDREAIFYCLSGEGIFLLDGIERRVGPGDGMFMPLGALHGGLNAGTAEFRFLDCALFTDQRSSIEVGDRCFANLDQATAETERGATVRNLFSPEIFGNKKIEWWGELWLEPGQEMSQKRYPEAEQILYVLEGTGLLHLWDREVSLRPGSIAYIVAGASHAITNTSDTRLRLVGSRSRIGRVPPCDYYRTLAL